MSEESFYFSEEMNPNKWNDFPLIPIMMPNENALKVLRGEINSIPGPESEER